MAHAVWYIWCIFRNSCLTICHLSVGILPAINRTKMLVPFLAYNVACETIPPLLSGAQKCLKYINMWCKACTPGFCCKLLQNSGTTVNVPYCFLSHPHQVKNTESIIDMSAPHPSKTRKHGDSSVGKKHLVTMTVSLYTLKCVKVAQCGALQPSNCGSCFVQILYPKKSQAPLWRYVSRMYLYHWFSGPLHYPVKYVVIAI